MLYLSVGHSKIDPGARANGTSEYIELSLICGLIYNLVSPYYKTELVDLSLPETIKYLNTRMQPDDIAIECHMDAVANGSRASGATLFYNKLKPGMMPFGDKLLTEYCGMMNLKSRGVKPDTATRFPFLGFVRIRKGRSYLLELGFITNSSELNLVREKAPMAFTKAFLQAVASLSVGNVN